MGLMDLFATAFEAGCGLGINEVLGSRRFDELLEDNKKLSQRFPVGTDVGLALRVGHLEMGGLFNRFSEQKALEEALKLTPNTLETPVDHEIRALIQLLGEKLVETAEDCLPREAIALTKDWSRKPVREQIIVIQRLFELFTLESQRFGLLTEDKYDDLVDYWIKKHEGRSINQVLPKRFGRWGEGGNPNCLGITLMLVALAHLNGIKVYLADAMEAVQDIRWVWDEQIINTMLTDINVRQLRNDEEFAHAIEVNKRYNLAYCRYNRGSGFHSAVMFQLGNGRWILLDPHGVCWGIFPKSWRLDEVDHILAKYGPVLPGLSLARVDRGVGQRWFKRQVKLAKTFLERSRRLDMRFQQASEPAEIFEILANDQELDFLIKELPVPEELVELVGRRLLAEMLLCGFGLDTTSMLFGFLSLEQVRKKQIDQLLTFYHYCALQKYYQRWHSGIHGGKLLHPSCQISNCEYSLALSVLNSINSINHQDQGHLELDEFFLNQTFDQMYLRNAIAASLGLATFGQKFNLSMAATRAEQALRSLPLIHPIARKCLGYLEHRRVWFDQMQQNMKWLQEMVKADCGSEEER